MTKNVILIGGAHIDIAGVPEHKLRSGEKNYGSVSFSAGGVALNVARNLSRLGIESTLLSLTCDDANSQIIIDECAQYNIDISESIQLKGYATPNYLYIVDFDGDTHLGISDMKLYEMITPEFLKTKLDLINSHRVCFIDANLSHDSLEFLLKNITIPTMVDPVSVDHCKKLKDIIHLAHTIKPNEKELEALCDITPDSSENLLKAKNHFIHKGVHNVFFSLGERGLYYGDAAMQNHLVHKVGNVINTNGAGDAMMAALVYGKLNDYDIDKTAKIGMSASIITLQSHSAGRDLSQVNIHKKMEEIQ
jgi:pseudouridine kinase